MADIKTDREALLIDLSGTLDYLKKRISAKRFNVREGDSNIQGFIRLYLMGVKVKADVLKDKQDDEILERLTKLEEELTLIREKRTD